MDQIQQQLEQATGLQFTSFFKHPFTGLYLATWGDSDKYGFITPNGKVFIPNILDSITEPWNDCILLVSDDKYGALDIQTYRFVLPVYDEVGDDVECDIVFIKDGVPGYVDEETGTFVPVADYEADEGLYDNYYFFNTRLND